LFDALRDQLGLRLQETKGPVDSVEIERVERPPSNDAPLPATLQGAAPGPKPSFEVASLVIDRLDLPTAN